MSDQLNTSAEFHISGDTLKKYTGQSRHLAISEDIKGIASAAFLGVSTLESITIPDGVEYLDRRCFENCIHLKTVSIPDSVTRIGEYAFSGCLDLDYVRLPAGLSRIESYTFKNCSSLSAVIIPPGVTEIAVDAFIGCKSLESVHIHEGVTSFPSVFNHHPFTGCDKLQIYTPSGSAAEKFAKDNGIPYVIKTIDSPNQVPEVVKPEASKTKVTRQTIASTKGIFSFSEIEEYLPENLTDTLLREAEEVEAARKARQAAAMALAPTAYDEDAKAEEEAYTADKMNAAVEAIHLVEQEKTDAYEAEVAASETVESEAVVTEAEIKPVEKPKVAPEEIAVKKPEVIKKAPEPEAAEAEKTFAAEKAEGPVTTESADKVDEPVKATEPVKVAEPVKAAAIVKPEEPAKAEKPNKVVKKDKVPKEKPVKEKKPPKEKKSPKPKSSKGRTARIAALLVIAAVALAVILIAAMNMNNTTPQASEDPTDKTEVTQKDDYVLTLEDFVNSSDTAKSQINQSIDGTDVKVTVSGNKLIYTYDLSNTEGLSADDADSDEIRTALEGTLDASNDRFVELCRSLEKDTGISGISVEIIYSYDDKILLTREYTANGQKQ